MRYVIKWTDVSQGFHFPCEKRNLSKARAIMELVKFKRRFNRYYKGAMEPYCPFINVRVEVDNDQETGTLS